jgi:hypothetical protein
MQLLKHERIRWVKQLAKIRDLTGQKFGRLTVVSYAGMSDAKRRRHKWNCECECGAMVVHTSQVLSGKHRHSCGCWSREIANEKSLPMRKTPVYIAWANAKTRCCNPNVPGYKDYGGRGISMCKRWFDSFDAFYEDMGPIPEGHSSIDRIDVNGNYEPGNCRWATPLMQGENTRRTVLLTHNGITRHASEWSRVLGVCLPTIYGRKKRGYSDARCLGLEES